MFAGCLLSAFFLFFHLLLPWIKHCHAIAINPNPVLDAKLRTAAGPSSNDSSVIWPADSSSPIALSNRNISNLNSIDVSGSLPQCDGRLYGRNLRLNSCLQLWHAMGAYQIPQTFGERGTGQYDAPLPFRYASHDGLCALDLGHASGVLSDSIAPVDLKVAARLLISVCVAQAPSQGGLITGLGQNKALALRLMPYRPTVTCGPDGSGPPWRSCRDIVDNMPANNEKQVFGPREDTRTTVPLPWRYTTTRQRCGVIVDGDEPGRTTDAGDWYKIWVATNAVEFMCTQLGRNGTAVSLGELNSTSCNAASWHLASKS